uniref:FBD domain-containing protein n=1 Tax=Oryza nivara TaxID=4536 RepID=A0A0E0I4S3_ORYNI
MARKNTRLLDATSAAAAVDLISELNDDVLLRILGLLPSARDVARTAVLSKWWRHLCGIAPCLRFDVSSSARCHDAARRLIAGVDACLARRRGGGAANAADVDVLEISLVYTDTSESKHGTFKRVPVGKRFYFHDHRHEADVTPSLVDSWLRFAERHVKGSFVLEVPLNAAAAAALDRAEETSTAEQDYQEEESPAPELEEEEVVELPATSRAEAMSITLGGANTAVPIAGAGAFHALTDFTLCRAKINAYDDGDLRLGHLLSSPCCPRLRRLELRHVAGLIRLHLDAADALEELRLVYLPDLLRLHVDAPGLRLLRVGHCDNLPCSGDPAPVRVSAPRLEALAWDRLECIACREVIATATVRHLKKIYLFSHGGDDDETNVAAVRLLKSCTAESSEDTMKEIPYLPTVTNLRLDVNTWWKGHTIGATLARIIAKCNNIKHLSIRVIGLFKVCSDPQCNCSQPEGWEDQKIRLEHLKKVEFKGFIPCDDRKSLLRLLLENAPVLEKINVKLNNTYILQSPEEVREYTNFDVPGYQGLWTPYEWKYRECGIFDGATKYEWTRETN